MKLSTLVILCSTFFAYALASSSFTSDDDDLIGSFDDDFEDEGDLVVFEEVSVSISKSGSVGSMKPRKSEVAKPVQDTSVLERQYSDFSEAMIQKKYEEAMSILSQVKFNSLHYDEEVNHLTGQYVNANGFETTAIDHPGFYLSLAVNAALTNDDGKVLEQVVQNDNFASAIQMDQMAYHLNEAIKTAVSDKACEALKGALNVVIQYRDSLGDDFPLVEAAKRLTADFDHFSRVDSAVYQIFYALSDKLHP